MRDDSLNLEPSWPVGIQLEGQALCLPAALRCTHGSLEPRCTGEKGHIAQKRLQLSSFKSARVKCSSFQNPLLS